MFVQSVKYSIVFIVVFCLILSPRTVFAEDSDNLEDSNNLGLPDEVNSNNITLNKDLFIPEMYKLIKDGQFAVRINREFRSDKDLSSAKDDSQKESVSQDGKIDSPIPLSSKLPFPDFIPDSTDNTLVPKLLWNSEVNWWKNKVISYSIKFSLFSNDKFTKGIEGLYTKAYPFAIDSNEKSIQLLREKLVMQLPKGIDQLSWTTYRFFGKDEDILWLYNPAIKKVRELTGSNRSDPILGSVASLDDLFTWNGKVEGVAGKFLKRVSVLVPAFSTSNKLSLTKMEQGCFKVNNTESSIKWNVDDKSFPGLPGWVPTSKAFIKKDLYELDLFSTDFFSIYGRQILYLEADTLAPVYKLVFDKGGKISKLVMTSYGRTIPKEGIESSVIPEFTILIDAVNKSGSIIEYVNATFCTSMNEEIKPPRSVVVPTPTSLSQKK